jgi:hypothetical protein
MQTRPISLLATAVALALPMSHAEAAFTFSASSGDLSASVQFAVVGGNLIVTLDNLGGQVLAPPDVLTAVFFSATQTFTASNAALGPGSAFVFPLGGDTVGANWAYNTGLAAPNNATQGIYSAGFSFPGTGNFGCGGSCNNLDGIDYGLISAADDTTNGNAAVTGGNPLIQHAAVFNLGPAGAFNPDAPGAITNVSFQYGTSLGEPNVVPIPPAVWLLGSGLIGLLGIARRKVAA